jgi:plasmid stability protein
VTDILVRNVNPKLAKRIKERARRNRRSLSDETKALIEQGLEAKPAPLKMGDWLFSLVEDKYRGDDLVFERKGDPISPPPTFE